MTDTFDPDDPFEPFDPERSDPYEDLEDLTGGEVIPRLEDPTVPIATPPRSPLLTGLIVLLLLVVLSIAAFEFLRDDADEPDAATVTTVTTTEAPEDGGTPVTSPPGDETTTTSVPGTTVTATASFEPYEATGSALEVGDLKLAVDAIGPILLGSSAGEAVGRFVASFGEPDEDSGPVISTGAFGACAGDTERIVRFGALALIVVIDSDGTETFAGYRLDLAYGGLSHPSANLETLSGLAAGNSVRQLLQIYEAFKVTILTDPELGDVFELRSRNTDNLLLWGPVSSPEADGFVRGIYSPDACALFPAV
ncbi:MAG: hypothetical protein ACE5GC_03415 [Acidimicrobiia bacterium]